VRFMAEDACDVIVIAEREGAILRHARDDDWPRVDEITIHCYRPIHASYVAMLGEECYQSVRQDLARRNPGSEPAAGRKQDVGGAAGDDQPAGHPGR